MAGVHGLEHVQGFPAADFANYDPVRPHAQGIPHEIADANGTAAFDVFRPAFQTDHVLLLQLQFHGVFNGDDAFVVGNERGKNVEQCGFSRAGTAGDDDVQACLDTGVEQLCHGR